MKWSSHRYCKAELHRMWAERSMVHLIMHLRNVLLKLTFLHLLISAWKGRNGELKEETSIQIFFPKNWKPRPPSRNTKGREQACVLTNFDRTVTKLVPKARNLGY